MNLTNYTTRRARKALPCPFCGNKRLDLETDEDTDGSLGRCAYVRCPECSGMGPSAYEGEIGRGVNKTAIALWNKRITL